MSFDLFFWDPPAACDDDEVRARYVRACEETPDEADEAAGESAAVTALYGDLVARFPDHDIEEAAVDDLPWSDTPLPRSDRWLLVHLRFSVADAVIDWLEELAERHRVVIYDPQGDEVHRPSQ